MSARSYALHSERPQLSFLRSTFMAEFRGHFSILSLPSVVLEKPAGKIAYLYVISEAFYPTVGTSDILNVARNGHLQYLLPLCNDVGPRYWPNGKETAAMAVVGSVVWCPSSSRLHRLVPKQ